MTAKATQISGYAAAALRSLTPAQIAFLQNLPKAELHAHLNGSIPLPALQALARKHVPSSSTSILIEGGLSKLGAGVDLNELNDFFDLFPAIYALTSTPDALAFATRAVLCEFLDGEHPQCTYLELRSTPRETPAMTRLEYMQTVLSEVERYPDYQAAAIVSVDRRMEDRVVKECIHIAKQLKAEGRRVVGIDLCGDPLAGDMRAFAMHIKEAKDAGLRITLHIAETAKNSVQDTLELLSFKPDRLGHATFLNDEAKEIVLSNKTCVELCLTSNLLCKTVENLEDHHIRYYLKNNHPIAICTDDILPFRNSLLGEYALLMAQAPLGLALSAFEVEKIARMSIESRF